MSKKILIIAHDFPPMTGGGVQRPVAFAKYLPQFGYTPIVLTRRSACGRPVDAGPLADLPAEVQIERIDPDPENEWEWLYRRLNFLAPVERLLGRPTGSVAVAIAWRLSQRRPGMAINRAWIQPALTLGSELIRRQRPDVLLATGPPFSTLKVGAVLAERFDLPLVSDFRDPWTYAYMWRPISESHARSERAWEHRVVARSSHVVVVTPSMAARMRDDYPPFAEKVRVITNGYDDHAIVSAAREANRKLTITHVGTIINVRQPTALLNALNLLQDRHPEVAADLCIRFVGPSDPPLRTEIATRKLDGLVEDLGSVSSVRSKEYMRSADVLLVQEFVATMAIPGKIFEYLAACRPILALVKEDSDSAWLLRQTGIARIVGSDDREHIVEALVDLWRSWRNGELRAHVDSSWLSQFHRRELTRSLADLLNSAPSATRP